MPGQRFRNRLLIPDLNYRSDIPRERSEVRYSLQNAHLHSPTLTAADMATEADAPVLFQFPDGLATPIQRISTAEVSCVRFDFVLSDADFANLVPAPSVDPASRLLTSAVTERSLRFRLRCIKAPPPGPTAAEDEAALKKTWFGKPTTYPSFAGVSLNGHPVELRRGPRGHKADLPTDVTRLLRRGANALELYVLDTPGMPPPADDGLHEAAPHAHYAAAVERLAFATEGAVALMARAAVARASETRERVARMLGARGSGGGGDDDDVQLVSAARVPLALRDPLTGAQLLCDNDDDDGAEERDIAVRGANCRHLQCFALRPFLRSRPRARGPALAPSPAAEAAAAALGLRADDGAPDPRAAGALAGPAAARARRARPGP